jgi:putative colanic acid biosynthesis acetyltransferase WcaF
VHCVVLQKLKDPLAWKLCWDIFGPLDARRDEPLTGVSAQHVRRESIKASSDCGVGAYLAAITPRNRTAIDARTRCGLPQVDCYNMAMITIGARTVISQRAVLCAGTHDINDQNLQLTTDPIRIGDDVWIAAEAFIAGGFRVGNGCVLGARACAFADLNAWTVYRGNPAVPIKPRAFRASPETTGR